MRGSTVGKHSGATSGSGFKQFMGALRPGKTKSGRHATAAGVLRATNRKPVMAAIAIPTAAIAAVTVAGVSSQQGDGTVHVDQDVVASDIAPLQQTGNTQSKQTRVPQMTGGVRLETPAPEPTHTQAPAKQGKDSPSKSKKSSSQDKSSKQKTPKKKSSGDSKHPTSTKASGKGGSCKASFYSEGQQTATGERFNPNALTAAHKTLPFNSRVKVTNKKNGKSVTVRINDRGPYVAGRCLDLSKAAMKKVGGISAGHINVTWKVL
nr:septal ring lytic transglycosylase RlpA family protein [Brevibacterium sp. 50QC2O2]